MIEYEAFREWIQERFQDFRERRGEIKINSFFAEDRKFHLYCNPAKNAYHCWKSGRSGNLIQLVAEVDQIELEDAARILGVSNPLRYYDERLEELFHGKAALAVPPPPQIELPEFTFLIESLSDAGQHRRMATAYLESRRIPVKGMYVCTSGKKYRDRIVIPYRNREGALIYWNARDYKGGECRYLGPDRDTYLVGKEDVIYFYQWPRGKTRVMLTEGEFDAISLHAAGLCGGACGGKQLFDRQVEYLEGFPVCLSFDNDERGGEALHNIGTRLLREGKPDLTYVRPPAGFKDWNQMLIERGAETIRAYVHKYQRPFDQWTSVLVRK